MAAPIKKKQKRSRVHSGEHDSGDRRQDSDNPERRRGGAVSDNERGEGPTIDWIDLISNETEVDPDEVEAVGKIAEITKRVNIDIRRDAHPKILGAGAQIIRTTSRKTDRESPRGRARSRRRHTEKSEWGGQPEEPDGNEFQ